MGLTCPSSNGARSVRNLLAHTELEEKNDWKDMGLVFRIRQAAWQDDWRSLAPLAGRGWGEGPESRDFRA